MLLICSERRISEPGGMTTQRRLIREALVHRDARLITCVILRDVSKPTTQTVRGTLPGSNSITGRASLGNKINQGKLSR
jgi:hypothetical protein